MNTVQIDLDLSWDEDEETAEEVLAEIVRVTGAKAEILTESGPAGGWPVARFTLEREALSGLFEALGYDASDIEYFSSLAEPAC